MPIEYHVEATLGVVFERWTGVITARDVSEHLKALLSDKQALACRRSLADIRECEIQLSGTDVGAATKAIAEPALRGQAWTTAILVQRPVEYGLARQFQALTDTFITTAVFTDESAAREWITPGPTSPAA